MDKRSASDRSEGMLNASARKAMALLKALIEDYGSEPFVLAEVLDLYRSNLPGTVLPKRNRYGVGTFLRLEGMGYIEQIIGPSATYQVSERALALYEVGALNFETEEEVTQRWLHS